MAAGPFNGVGRKLGGDSQGAVDSAAFLIDGQQEDDEELMLAKAISASLEVAKSPPAGPLKY